MRRKLGIIILNYKTPDLVIDCLHSLREQIEPGIEVVVVDNASNDGSAERIEEEIASNQWGSWVRVLCSPVNGGFSAGNNLGIRAIDADAYILLNSDTIVLPDTIRELLHAMELWPNAGLIGPGCVTQDGNKDQSTFQFIRPITDFIRSASTGPISRLLRRYDTPFLTTDSAAEPDWIGFACVLIRREVIEEVGLLDDGFFMYFEDVDYCHRARNAGWTILYWPRGKIVHLLGGSSEFASKKALQHRAPRYFYEARSRYFAKHYGRIGLLSANLAWLLGRCISLARERLGSKQPHHRKNEALDIWINVLNPFRTSPMPGKGKADQ
jgi:GT2 family glycosyltransferase